MHVCLSRRALSSSLESGKGKPGNGLFASGLVMAGSSAGSSGEPGSLALGTVAVAGIES